MDYLAVIAFIAGLAHGVLAACFALLWCAVVDLGRELEKADK